MQKLLIYIDSFDNQNRAQTRELIDLYQYADQEKYSLIDTPAKADLIILGDAEFENYGEKIMGNIVLKNHINKSFILSYRDRPIPLVRGLYTSAEKSLINFNRIRSCAYTAYYKSFRNPFIYNHQFKLEEKKYLFSFIGRDSHICRSRFFKMKFDRKDIFIENSSNKFNLYDQNKELACQKQFYDVLLSSKFSICLRGSGASSIRLFESMQLGIAPVIISDEWILPKGPRWNEFSLILKLRDLPNLEKIISKNENKYLEMGLLARKEYLKYFDDKVYFNYVIENCLHIRLKQLIPEIFFYKFLDNILLFFLKFKNWSNNKFNKNEIKN